jgi:peptidoglycan/LPS O-acetylase OafA/YrhL
MIPGYSAVAFFFILSGYVLALRYAGSDLKLNDYFIRRIARLWPSAMLSFLATVIIYILFRQTGAGYYSMWGALLTPLLMQSWIPLQSHVRQSWNGVSWTLSCEAFFYIMFPFFLPRIKRMNSKKAGGFLIILLITYLCII